MAAGRTERSGATVRQRVKLNFIAALWRTVAPLLF